MALSLFAISSPNLETFPEDELLRCHNIPLHAPVAQIESTHYATYVLLVDGTVVELSSLKNDGRGAFPQSDYRHDFSLRIIELPGRVELLACGTEHVLFGVQMQGQTQLRIFAMGDNTDGQCGLAARKDKIMVPVIVPSVSKLPVKRLYAGSAFSACILSNGSLVFWGGLEGRFGSLPRLITLPASRFRVSSVDLCTPTQAAIGDFHVAVLTSDGHVHCFNTPSVYWMGLQDSEMRGDSDPIEVTCLTSGAMSASPVVQIAATDDTTYAVSSAGIVYSWGKVHVQWLELSKWLYPGTSIDEVVSLPNDLIPSESRQLVCTHQRWRKLMLSKTGTREGGDIRADTSDTVIDMMPGVPPAFQATWRERFLGAFANKSVPWLLSQVLGVTKDGRLLPADGYLRMHRVQRAADAAVSAERQVASVAMSTAATSPPSAAAVDDATAEEEEEEVARPVSSLREKAPMLHDFLTSYLVHSATQTRDHLVFLGTEDTTLKNATLLQLAYADSRRLRVGCEFESVWRPIRLGDTDSFFQDYLLPPVWPVSVDSAALTNAIHQALTQTMRMHLMDAIDDTAEPNVRQFINLLYHQAKDAPDEHDISTIADLYNVGAPLQLPEVDPTLRPAETSCFDVDIVDVCVILMQAALLYSANRTHTPDPAAIDIISSANFKRAAGKQLGSRVIIPTMVHKPSTIPSDKLKKPAYDMYDPRVHAWRAETLYVDDDDGFDDDTVTETDADSRDFEGVNSSDPDCIHRFIAGPAERRVVLELEHTQYKFSIPLNWWEQQHTYDELCNFAYGSDSWKGDVKASLQGDFLVKYVQLVEETSAAKNPTKRAKCRRIALLHVWKIALEACAKRRCKMALVLRRLKPDFTLMLEDGTTQYAHESFLIKRLATIFGAMIASNMKEARERVWKLTESITAAVYPDFLSYIYTGHVNLTCDNVQELSIAADVLFLDDLKDLCEHFLIVSYANETTAPDLMQLATTHNLPRLVKCCHCILGTPLLPRTAAVAAAIRPKAVVVAASAPVDNAKRSWASVATKK